MPNDRSVRTNVGLLLLAIDPDRIVPMGYSLGTGVATYLAAERPVAATVLVSPFDAITLRGNFTCK